MPCHSIENYRFGWLYCRSDRLWLVQREAYKKPEKGHLLKSGEELLKHLKEYRVEETSSYEIGNQITVKNFEVGQKVDISGKSMGRGFAGYQKRHGFSRGPMSHGSKIIELRIYRSRNNSRRIYPGKEWQEDMEENR